MRSHPRAVLDEAMSMLDVNHKILLRQLGLTQSPQPPPRIIALA